MRHFWIPVWTLPEGVTLTERVLQYPTCLIVVAQDYARFYGVVTGLSTVTLQGSGWAVGVMLQPGAAQGVFGRSDTKALVDSHVDLATLPHLAGIIAPVHAAMTPAPSDPSSHRAAIQVLTRTLHSTPAPRPDGLLLTQVVDLIESDPQLRTVADLAARVRMGERRLQRLTHRLLGLSPKWLIQRRRLHEAAARLKEGEDDLAGLAADLGYTDQAHFTRDFGRVTGYPPGAFVRTLGRQRPR